MKRLVEDHLDGQLERLRVEYDDNVTMKMEFVYKSDDECHMVYVVCVHIVNETIRFLEHFCNYYGREYIDVRSVGRFERALHDHLFPNE
jgi:hypothetical protein